MNTILLINPPFSRKEEYRFWFSSLGTKANPPLGLAYIASACIEKGYSVRIIDALAEGLTLKELKKRIAEVDPKIVGVTATTPMINNAFEVLRLAKECSKTTLTVLGGPHITSESFSSMQECGDLDVGVLGEGEVTFAELAEVYLSSDKRLDKVAGIIYRQDGQFVTNRRREYIKDINDIPLPAYDLLPMHLYSPSPLNYRRFPAISMLSSRGCPFQCSFCTKSIFGDVVRKLNPGKVYEQVKYLVDNYKIKEIHFYDDTFILGKDWVKEVCSYLEKLDISWWCNGHVDIISEEVLFYLKKAGCYRIYYGVESASEKSLRLLNKVSSVEKIRYAFKITREAKIKAGAFMILGIPGENGQDMQRSIDLVKEIKADHAVFSIMTPYPGTEIYKDFKKYGTMNKASWKDFIMISDNPIFVAYSTNGKELNKYLSLAYKSIIFSPRFLTNKIKDIFYCPKKLFLYTKGFIYMLKNIIKDIL